MSEQTRRQPTCEVIFDILKAMFIDPDIFARFYIFSSASRTQKQRRYLTSTDKETQIV